MADIYCKKCGEPWDTDGLFDGDLDAKEAQKVRNGRGCPSCGWGKRCPSCRGTGRELFGLGDPCGLCNDLRSLRVYKVFGGEWCHKGTVLGKDITILQIDDDWAIVRCPRCEDEALWCEACGGDGKLKHA